MFQYLIEQLSGPGRRNVIVGAAAGVVLLLAVVVGGVVLLSGGDDEPEEVPSVLFSEGEVMLRVQQTIEAMGPTPTPIPTPDVAATLQAELEYNRKQVARIVQLNPLDSEEFRNPYLKVEEVEYLSSLGPVLWDYVQVWMHLRQVLSVDVEEWSLGMLEYHVGVSKQLLEHGGGLEYPRQEDVGDVVRAYVQRLVEGTYGVDEGVRHMDDALRLLAMVETGVGMDLEFQDREKLSHVARRVTESLAVFDDAMSKYGCSICGELFRVRP